VITRTDVSEVSTGSTTTAGATAATSSTIGDTTVLKYELRGGVALNTDVTLDNLMYSTATELYKRQPRSSYNTVQRVDVYSSPVTKAKYDAKRQEFAAQGISTAETWVFHGTKSTDNLDSIMTEGFKVRDAQCLSLCTLLQ
jgi:hypothetical protein